MSLSEYDLDVAELGKRVADCLRQENTPPDREMTADE